MRIKITNKIRDKITEYQRTTGASQVWIAQKMNISKSRLYQIGLADDMMLSVALRVAIFFKCPIEELFDYEEVDD